MSIFRSEKMGLYHIAMSKESAYEVLSELGDSGQVQFIDQNKKESNTVVRPFQNQIKRCEELQNKIELILNQAKLYGSEPTICKNIPQYLKTLKANLEQRGKAPYTYLDEIEDEIESKEASLQEQIENYEKFLDHVNQLNEYKNVLQHSKETLSEHLYGKQNLNIIDDEENNDGELKDIGIGLTYMAGVVETNDLLRFKRMVFRATRANSWCSTNDIAPIFKDERKGGQDLVEVAEQEGGNIVQSKEAVRKASFLIIFQGGETDAIKNRLVRIADSFGASRYPLPADPSHYMKKMMEIESSILEETNTMRMTSRTIEKMVKEWTGSRGKESHSYIEELRLFVLREKALYTNMNLLNIKNEIFDGQYWCPESFTHDVQNTINALHANKVNLPQTTITPKDFKGQTPPTHFQTNEFTGTFQLIVDTYGIARYQEINPGLFCCGMFPVKFGMMFGDIGHGGLLLAAGICMTKYSDKLKANGMEAVAEVRYLFLLMGVFAFYCGFLYNDFFSLPFNLFGSCFENVPGTKETTIIENCVYPLGLDPKWYIATNELSFMNSLKMKLAVIIGVVQMSWGIILKGSNAVINKNWVDFFFEFVPQIVFLTCTFGYMDFMIFYKWSIHFEDTHQAPSIISQMINMPLKLGEIAEYPLWDAVAQANLQYNFLIIALVMVPTLLLPKPIILFLQDKMRSNRKVPAASELQQELLDNDQSEEALRQNLQNEKAKTEGGSGGHGHGDEEFEIGEVVVHQVIETIEFVLGSISNTASYLRLWALSLAHGQLAKVFFEKTLGGGIQSGNIIALLIGWFLFVNITLGVIMAMDLMECFLHALRLQWVEFQNKFYKADGYKFQPFSFKVALKPEY